MGLLFIIPVLLAIAVIGVFILNYMDFISIEKMDTPLARVILILSFLLVAIFVIWFVFTIFSPGERDLATYIPL